jgi:hypothetical protein
MYVYSLNRFGVSEKDCTTTCALRMLQWRGNVNGRKSKKTAVFPLKPTELANVKTCCAAAGAGVTITYNDGHDERHAATPACGLIAGLAGSAN